jgi:DNA polymerase-3 subunit gamma/tau
MENYIVSARKYRPTTFDSVVGQTSITSTLKNAIKSNHLAQAFLFCGPRGVGKTTCARILAKTINCFSITENIEACDECESCKSFNEGRSLNIQELDGASNNGVDEIRNLIDQVRFAPQMGTHKVYIIDEVHMLSANAFNAFLKTLEEPPKHAIFILATTEKHKIIPTILSRCQIFDFNRIKIDDITKQLSSIAVTENVTTEDDGLHIIGQKADGSLRDALSMFDQIVSFSGGTITYKDVIENLNILDYDYYFKVTNALLNNNVSDCLLLFDTILNYGFDGHNFINGLAEHFRNLLVCQDEKTVNLLEVGSTIKEKYLNQAKDSNINQLISFLNITNKADTQYKSSKNQRLLVEVMLMQLCSNENPFLEKKKPIINLSIGKSNRSTPNPANQQEKTEHPEQKSEPISISKVEKPKANYTIPEPKTTLVKEEEKPIERNKTLEKVNNQERTAAEVSLKQSSNLTFSDSVSISINTSSDTKENNTLDDPKSTARPTEKYTPEKFAEIWNEYKLILQEKGKSSLVTIFDTVPKITDNIISLSIENKALEDEFKSHQADFLEFARKELSNYNINVVTQVNKDTKLKKAYTPQEKFVKMSEKNPNLKQLVKKLDMDVGYA